MSLTKNNPLVSGSLAHIGRMKHRGAQAGAAPAKTFCCNKLQGVLSFQVIPPNQPVADNTGVNPVAAVAHCNIKKMGMFMAFSLGYGWYRPFHLFHNPVVYDVHVKFNQYHPGNVKLM